MKRYGVLLVGCGSMGEAHIEKIYKKENVDLIGVVDLDIEKAKEFANKYSALSFASDYREYGNCSSLDIVIVATYPSTHFEIVDYFLKRGKHILCEKPVASNIEELDKFEKCVKNSKSKILIGHILRHNSTYQKVAQMINEGCIGKPVTMRISQIKNARENWDNNIINLLKDVSPIVDCGVHYIDMMRWFTGEEVTSINGLGQKFYSEQDAKNNNYELVNLTMSGGSTGFIEIGWGKYLREEHTSEFIGPLGRIRIIYKSQRPDHKNFGNLIEFEHYPEGTLEEYNISYDGKPTDRQFDYLINMIENNLDSSRLLNEICTATRLMLLGEKAIKSNRTTYIRNNN
jgi:predicted dehydrogenase